MCVRDEERRREESGLGGTISTIPSYTPTGQAGPEPKNKKGSTWAEYQGHSIDDWLVSGCSWPCARFPLFDWLAVKGPDSIPLVLCTWLYYASHRGCAGTRYLGIRGSKVVFSYSSLFYVLLL
jgi:hypothetical protein